MARVFISYRREDTIAYAGRIYDRLTSHFGVANVFMDIDTLEPGVDFVDALERTVRSCDIFLAVIGRHWLTVKDEDGRPRLAIPEDFVALEIAAALARRDIRVVPVLVAGAHMPPSTELPEKLAELARRQALILPDIGFHQALGRLIQSVEHIDQERAGQQRLEEQRLQEEKAEATRLAEHRRFQRQQEETLERAVLERLEREKAAAAQAARPSVSPREAPPPTPARRPLWILALVPAAIVLLGLWWFTRQPRPTPSPIPRNTPAEQKSTAPPQPQSKPDTQPPGQTVIVPPPYSTPVQPPSKLDTHPAAKTAVIPPPPEDHTAPVAAGIVYEYKTIGQYEAAIARNPNDADLRADYARALWGLGQTRPALEQFRLSTVSSPKYIGRAFLFRDYAEALEKLGDLDGAIAAGRKMMASWPTHNEPNCSGTAEAFMSRLLERKGDLEGAVSLWQDVRNRASHDTRTPGYAVGCDSQIARIQALRR